MRRNVYCYSFFAGRFFSWQIFAIMSLTSWKKLAVVMEVQSLYISMHRYCSNTLIAIAALLASKTVIRVYGIEKPVIVKVICELESAYASGHGLKWYTFRVSINPYSDDRVDVSCIFRLSKSFGAMGDSEFHDSSISVLATSSIASEIDVFSRFVARGCASIVSR